MSAPNEKKYSMNDLLEVIPLVYKSKDEWKANTKYCKVIGCYNNTIFCCITEGHALCKKHEYIYHYVEEVLAKLSKRA